MFLSHRFLTTTVVTTCLLLLSSSAQANVVFSESFEVPDASADDIQLASAALPGIFQFGDPIQTNITDDFGGSDGVQSLKIFGPFGGGTGFSTGSTIPAAFGDTIVAEIDVLTPSADEPPSNGGTSFLQIIFRDAGGNFAGTAAGGNQAEGFNFFQAAADPTFNSALDTFELLGVGTAPAPDNTAWAEIVLVRINPAFQGGSQVFDNLRVSNVVIPEPGTITMVATGVTVFLAGYWRRRRAVNS